MYYALVNYPEIKNKEFHDFRNRYDPYSHLLPAHITFIFPVPDSPGLKNLENHIQKIVDNRQPIDARFNKLEKTLDHWLMLTPTEGKEKAVKLHDDLYTEILAPYLRKDLPYSPHIGLGFFSKENYIFDNPTAQLTLDEPKYEKALSECKSLGFDYQFTIDQLTLIEVNETFTTCKNISDFNLTGWFIDFKKTSKKFFWNSNYSLWAATK